MAHGLEIQSTMVDFLTNSLKLLRWVQHHLLGFATFHNSPGANLAGLEQTSAGPAPWADLSSLEASRAANVRLVKGASTEDVLVTSCSEA